VESTTPRPTALQVYPTSNLTHVVPLQWQAPIVPDRLSCDTEGAPTPSTIVEAGASEGWTEKGGYTVQ
jgi:hypothetical protein